MIRVTFLGGPQDGESVDMDDEVIHRGFRVAIKLPPPEAEDERVGPRWSERRYMPELLSDGSYVIRWHE